MQFNGQLTPGGSYYSDQEKLISGEEPSVEPNRRSSQIDSQYSQRPNSVVEANKKAA